MVTGIDIRQSVGKINPVQVKAAGHSFVILEATEGTDPALTAPSLKANVEACQAAGLPVGCYHFAYPALNIWQAELGFFHQAIAGLPLDLPHFLDFETPGGLAPAELGAWAKAWLDADGPDSVLYSYRSLYDSLPGAPWGHRVWMAIPGAATYSPYLAVQTSSGSVPGVPLSVDFNIADPALLPVPVQPVPAQEEGEMLLIFEATVVAGQDKGVAAQFVSNGMFYRWIESGSQLADIQNVGATFNRGPVATWPGGPVADPGAFGLPADTTTAAMLGLPFAGSSQALTVSLTGTATP